MGSLKAGTPPRVDACNALASPCISPVRFLPCTSVGALLSLPSSNGHCILQPSPTLPRPPTLNPQPSPAHPRYASSSAGEAGDGRVWRPSIHHFDSWRDCQDHVTAEPSHPIRGSHYHPSTHFPAWLVRFADVLTSSPPPRLIPPVPRLLVTLDCQVRPQRIQPLCAALPLRGRV